MEKIQIDSIIFDLDGTLWDSTDVVARNWQEVVEKHEEIERKISLKDVQSVMGLQMDELGKRLLPGLKDEDRALIIKECMNADNNYLKEHGARLYDKVEDVLKKLSEKYKLFIVSNCGVGYIEAFYEGHKIDKYFTDFENPGRTGLSKAENIKLIVERNNLKHPIYVGDTQGDRDAARGAKVPFVYASYGFGEVRDYDFKINSFEELLKL